MFGPRCRDRLEVEEDFEGGLADRGRGVFPLGRVHACHLSWCQDGWDCWDGTGGTTRERYIVCDPTREVSGCSFWG